MSSLRVFGQTASLGLVSNSHSFLPVAASNPRTQPSPWAITTWSSPAIRPAAGDDHWPCRIRSFTELSLQTSFPVSLCTAMSEGARGEGTFTWVSSWPLEVPTYTRSPKDTGDELARLWGN